MRKQFDQHEQSLARVEKSLLQQFKQMSRYNKTLEGRLAVNEEEANLYKNKLFLDVKYRLEKCEQFCTKETWNE